MLAHLPMRLDYYQYCVETWAEIFRQLDFKKMKTVIDLCPGWSPKIELALLKTDFNQTLIAVDNSQESLDCFTQLLNPFPKKFKVKTKAVDILASKKDLRIEADLVVANHIFDDLIAGFYMKRKGKRNIDIFGNMNLLGKIWKDILTDKNLLEEVYRSFRQVIIKIVRKNGYLFIAQYFGYQEKLHQLNVAYRLCKKIIKKLEGDLIKENLFCREEKIISASFSTLTSPYFPKEDLLCLKKLD